MSYSIPFGDQPDSRPSPAKKPNGRRRRISPLGLTIGVIIALIAVVLIASEVWTRFLWFDQIGYTAVLVTRWVTQAALFLAGFVVFAIPLFVSLRYCFRSRPLYPPVTREQEALEQFRTAVDPLRRGITIAAPIVIGLFAGLALARRWQDVQLFLHPQKFGQVDEIFGKDIGFYVFTMPVIDTLLGVLQFVIIVTIIASLVGHFVYGGIEWSQESGLKVTTAARRHLGILAVVFLLRQAAAIWFERYGLLNGEHGRFDGASYADAHAIIPAKTILAIAALIVAILFVLWIIKGDIRIAAIGAGLIILSSLVVGTIYPWAVQRFQVQPNERVLEQPFIQHNIDATRDAYDLNDVKEVQYAATAKVESGALREDAETTAQIRLLDPAVVSPTFNQREANRRYWGFEDVLAVDRYEIDGKLQDTVIGVRELRPDTFKLAEQPWVNRHVVYTHGYGIAAAYGNRRDNDGEPSYFYSGVPGDGELGKFQEQVYFGRHSPDYSIVGGPEGDSPQEFDYQVGTDGKESGTQKSNTFEGDGGPKIGGLLNRLLYAVKFRDPNILISNYVNQDSQILYDRDPQQRVMEVAPFLSLDSKVYPAVVGDRLVWVVDGYTSSNRYPYSKSLDMNDTVEDSTTSSGDARFPNGSNVNYMRNGVKATVDAFDGSVDLYAWDTEDPILKSWSEVFPDALKPVSEVEGDLMGHLRYPEDMFKAQREILASYHVTKADEFYGGQEFWQVSEDPTASTPKNADGSAGKTPLQPPYYLTMQMPEEKSPRFTLSSSFIPAEGQNVLTGMLAIDSETGSKTGNPADSFGNMTMLVLPSTNPVSGPRQVQASFNSEPNVSKALNLLKSGNSEVINGNLLTVPVGGGLLYVQPVYLQSSQSGGGTQYPLLQMVLVSFGDKIGFAPTLNEALDKVFGGDSGANAGDAGVPADGVAGTADAGEEGSGSTEQAESGSKDDSDSQDDAKGSDKADKGSAQQRLDQALADMDDASKEADDALAKGDWDAYGKAQDKLAEALGRAMKANEELGGSGAAGGSGASDGGNG